MIGLMSFTISITSRFVAADPDATDATDAFVI